MLGVRPMLLFGPSSFMLPMLIAQHDIAVRDAPIQVPGLGTLHMDREEIVAGHTCVVVRIVFEGDDDFEEDGDVFEIAIAEDLPFPCFSRHGLLDEAVEAHLVEVR
jgi:hypothetical protein